MKPTKTWILVAGGAQARILENEGPGRGVRPVPNASWEQDVQKSQDIMADRPGRSFDRKGDQRHGMEPASDAKRLQESAFLGNVCSYLDEADRAGRFDRLILVAEPRALGMLRKELGRGPKEKLHGELDKDFTRVQLTELPDRLKDVVLL